MLSFFPRNTDTTNTNSPQRHRLEFSIQLIGNFMVRNILLLLFLVAPLLGKAELYVGIGKTDLTPPQGTPSAGYGERKGEPMEGCHDPLLAIALFIDNGEKQIVLCSVDNLGFTYEISQKIIEKVHRHPELSSCDIYISSSHTHSGGGAFLNIPIVGSILAGSYNPQVEEYYIDQTADAITQASGNRVSAKIGFGYGEAHLSQYRGLWPTDISPLPDVAIIKITRSDDTPLALLFNYPVHPTVLKSQNRLFSADFVGYARDHLQTTLGSDMQPIYVNGAQGDINPVILNEENRFEACDSTGKLLAKAVTKIWNLTETSHNVTIVTHKKSYSFKPQATPFGMVLPIDLYQTEMNLIVFNHTHAFLTMPGELSCLYDKHLKEIGQKLGYSHVSIMGLTNDAHGYIILPDSWNHKTSESRLSFGGEHYGEQTKQMATSLLEALSPR